MSNVSREPVHTPVGVVGPAILPTRFGSGRVSRGPGADAVTWLTLYIVVLFAIPSRLILGPLGSAGAPSMLLGLASLAFWLSFILTNAVSRPFTVTYPLKWAIAVFVVCVGVSYAITMSQPISPDEVSPADVALLSLGSWIGTMLLAHDAIRTRSRLEDLSWRFALAGGFMALLGLAQFVTKLSIVNLISIPGLTAVAEAAVYERNGLVRPAGTAIHPIEYGTLLTIILPIALHVALRRRDIALPLRWFPAVAILAVVAISSSRSAYLGAVIGVAVCVVAWAPKVRRIVALVAVAGTVVVAAAVPRLFNSIIGLFAGVESDPSISSRTDSFSFAWRFIVDSPFFGRGLGTFLPKYRIFDNEYLGMLVTIGFVGTAAFVCIGIVAVAQLLRVYGAATDDGTKDFSVSLIGSIAAGFASLAFFDAFAFPMTMGTLFLAIGIAGALVRLESVARRPLQ